MDKDLLITLTRKELVQLIYEAKPELFLGFTPDDLSDVQPDTANGLMHGVKIRLRRKDIDIFKPLDPPPDGIEGGKL